MTKTKYKRTTKEKAIACLVELTNDLYYKQKSHHSLHRDKTYFGIRDKNIFTIIKLIITMNRSYYEVLSRIILKNMK